MDIARFFIPIIAGGNALVNRINAWQSAQSTLVHAAGVEEALFARYAAISGNTYISPGDAFRESGVLKSIVCLGNDADQTNQSVVFKVFRWNATTSLYDLVGEETFVVTYLANAKYTVNFTTTINVQIGDVPGYYSAVAMATSKNASGYTMGYVSGNITTSDAFAGAAASRRMNFECKVLPPYLAVTGDSIPEGHNVAAVPAQNCGGLHIAGLTGAVVTIPWPVPNAEIMAQLKAIIGNGTVLKYQNLALGSQTFAWVASTGIVQCIAVKPKAIIIHCGINDVATAREWAAVEADLDTIAAAVAAASPVPTLFIDEILPWNAGSDAQAATIRTWNGNLATWCAANGATLILCHNEMGLIRAATGELDNIIADYNYDNVHLSASGVAKLASVWKRYL